MSTKTTARRAAAQQEQRERELVATLGALNSALESGAAEEIVQTRRLAHVRAVWEVWINAPGPHALEETVRAATQRAIDDPDAPDPRRYYVRPETTDLWCWRVWYGDGSWLDEHDERAPGGGHAFSEVDQKRAIGLMLLPAANPNAPLQAVEKPSGAGARWQVFFTRRTDIHLIVNPANPDDVGREAGRDVRTCLGVRRAGAKTGSYLWLYADGTGRLTASFE